MILLAPTCCSAEALPACLPACLLCVGKVFVLLLGKSTPLVTATPLPRCELQSAGLAHQGRSGVILEHCQ